MVKRRATTEFKIAALSAAIELVSRPEYSREWLKEEFVDDKVTVVRITSDIVDAVEDSLTEKLAEITKNLQAELDELLTTDDEPDEDEKTNS